MSDWTLSAIPLTVLASGAEVALVLHELVGRRGAGPTLGLSAAIHGDEAVGVEILYHLRQRLDPGTLRGRVLLLPCANPLAYQANTRNTPLDMTNLNRVFPGDPAGWFTEHLADTISRRFLAELDAYVDLHAGGAYPTVDYVYVFTDERLSRSFGSRFPTALRSPSRAPRRASSLSAAGPRWWSSWAGATWTRPSMSRAVSRASST